MAVIHTCDRCGGNIKGWTEVTHKITIPQQFQIIQSEKAVSNWNKELDLCLTCLGDLYDFLGIPRLQRIEE